MKLLRITGLAIMATLLFAALLNAPAAAKQGTAIGTIQIVNIERGVRGGSATRQVFDHMYVANLEVTFRYSIDRRGFITLTPIKQRGDLSLYVNDSRAISSRGQTKIYSISGTGKGKASMANFYVEAGARRTGGGWVKSYPIAGAAPSTKVVTYNSDGKAIRSEWVKIFPPTSGSIGTVKGTWNGSNVLSGKYYDEHGSTVKASTSVSWTITLKGE